MTESDPQHDPLATLTRSLSDETQEQALRMRRRGKRFVVRLMRTLALLALATFVIVFGMIASGLFLGPRAVEGLLALPLALLVTWSAIFYFGLLHNRAPRLPRVSSTTELLPLLTRAEEWLDAQRDALPAAARPAADRILQRLPTLAAQVEGLDTQAPQAFEVRRLIAEELPELVRGYRRIPRALKQKPALGGQAPDQHVIEGLSTVDEQLERLQAQLAQEDVRALATQQRYLEMKYKQDPKLKG